MSIPKLCFQDEHAQTQTQMQFREVGKLVIYSVGIKRHTMSVWVCHAGLVQQKNAYIKARLNNM